MVASDSIWVAKGGIWCRGAEVQKADCIDCRWTVMGRDGL